MSNFPPYLEQAFQSYRAGQWASAAELCQRALLTDPRSAPAHYLLGMALGRQNQLGPSIEHLSQAVACDPTVYQFQISLSSALRGAGQYPPAIAAAREAVRLAPEIANSHLGLANALCAGRQIPEAETSYRRALELDPGSNEALNNLGNVLYDQQRFGEALSVFQEASQRDPNSAAISLNLGNTLQALKMYAEATAAYEHCLQLSPNFPLAHFNLGNLLQWVGNLPAAAEHYQQALKLQPDFLDSEFALGTVWQKLNQLDKAGACYQRVIARQPNHAQAYFQMGNLFSIARRNGEGQAYYERAIELAPDDARLHMGLAMCLQMQAKFRESLPVYQRAIAAAPDDAEIRYFYGMACLSLGDFANGWPQFKWRLKSNTYADFSHTGPVWEGEPLAGRDLLVYTEGGLGDTLHFVRYLPFIDNPGGEIFLEVSQGLVPLLVQSGFKNVLPRKVHQLDPQMLRVSLLTLPVLFGTTPETIPAAIPYLFAKPERIEVWRQRLAGQQGFRVGINWQGSANAPFERRSTPLTWFEPLSRIPGATLISLQQFEGMEELRNLAGRFPVVDLGADLDRDGAFLDTAAIMKNLDLVITCDTSIAHLAGALGVPVWVPLMLASDWRWMRDREDTPWYPTMRLFRQSRLDDWAPVFQQMTEELANCVRAAKLRFE